MSLQSREKPFFHRVIKKIFLCCIWAAGTPSHHRIRCPLFLFGAAAFARGTEQTSTFPVRSQCSQRNSSLCTVLGVATRVDRCGGGGGHRRSGERPHLERRKEERGRYGKVTGDLARVVIKTVAREGAKEQRVHADLLSVIRRVGRSRSPRGGRKTPLNYLQTHTHTHSDRHVLVTTAKKGN